MLADGKDLTLESLVGLESSRRRNCTHDASSREKSKHLQPNQAYEREFLSMYEDIRTSASVSAHLSAQTRLCLKRRLQDKREDFSVFCLPALHLRCPDKFFTKSSDRNPLLKNYIDQGKMEHPRVQAYPEPSKTRATKPSTYCTYHIVFCARLVRGDRAGGDFVARASTASIPA